MKTTIRPLTRRAFLHGTAAVAGVSLLAACGGSASTTSATTTGTTSAGTAASTQASSLSASPQAGSSPNATYGQGSGGSTATSTSSAKGPTVASQIDTASVKKGGHVNFANVGDFVTFNPLLAVDGNSGSVINLVYETLVVVDPDTLGPAPLLATKWEVGSDNKTYTFTLKDGVKWHDGQPFTANDVKLTFDLAMNPKTGASNASELAARIASVSVTDPTTIVITLTSIIASFLVNDVLVSIVPQHLLQNTQPADLKTASIGTSPIGTGPFKFKQRAVGEYATLDKFPDYHRGEPALDQVVIKVGLSSESNYQALKTGEIDVYGISASDYKDAQQQTNFTIFSYGTFGITHIAFNLDPTKGPAFFQDVRVRQALCYAIDRPSIASKVLDGFVIVAVGIFPPLSWAYAPDQVTDKYEYDPKKAAALLDEAGWMMSSDGIRRKDGQKLSFTLENSNFSSSDVSIGEVMQQNYQAIGVDMQIHLDQTSAYVQRITQTFDFQLVIFPSVPGSDPDNWATYYETSAYPSGANVSKYSNPKADALWTEAAQTLDQAKRKQLYIEVENIVQADAPNFILFFSVSKVGINKRLKNYVPSAVYDGQDQYAYLWYVTDGK